MAYKKRSYSKKKKGRGGRVWKANYSAGTCGLVPTETFKGLDRHGEDEADGCMYLTCLGDEATPDLQIIPGETPALPDGSREFKQKIDGFACARCKSRTDARGVTYRAYDWCHLCKTEEKKNACKVKPVFVWYEIQANGDHRVKVWERAVKVSNAERLSYHVPRGRNGEYIRTVAAPGVRVIGNAHEVDKLPESPLMDIARVGYEVEAGLELEGAQGGAPTFTEATNYLVEDDKPNDIENDIEWLANL